MRVRKKKSRYQINKQVKRLRDANRYDRDWQDVDFRIQRADLITKARIAALKASGYSVG